MLGVAGGSLLRHELVPEVLEQGAGEEEGRERRDRSKTGYVDHDDGRGGGEHAQAVYVTRADV